MVKLFSAIALTSFLRCKLTSCKSANDMPMFFARANTVRFGTYEKVLSSANQKVGFSAQLVSNCRWSIEVGRRDLTDDNMRMSVAVVTAGIAGQTETEDGSVFGKDVEVRLSLQSFKWCFFPIEFSTAGV